MKISDIKGYLPTEANYRSKHGLKSDTAQLRLKEYKELEKLSQKNLLGTPNDLNKGDLGSAHIKDQLFFLRHPAAAITPQDLSHIYGILLKSPEGIRKKSYSRLAKKLGYTCVKNYGGDEFWIRPNRKKEFRKTMAKSHTEHQELRQLRDELKYGPENSGCFNFMTLFRMKRPTSPQG